MAGNVRVRGVEPSEVAADHIRNVVLVGHSGAGKTTVVEAVLAATGAVARTGRVEDGTTVSDHDEVEHRLGRSVSLTVASTVHGDVTINLIDTPGHADFVGEVRAGLRAADAALFVVSAVDGVDGATRLLWEECAGIELPRAVVVTTSTPAAATTTRSSRSVGDSSAPGCSPSTCRCSTTRRSRPAWIGLLSRTVVDLSTGRRVVRPADPEHLSAVEEPRSTLIEGIIQESEDDSLLDRWLEGEEVALDTLIADLETAVARGSFHPVLPCNPLTGLGVTELLEVIVSGFPSPVEHPLPA